MNTATDKLRIEYYDNIPKDYQYNRTYSFKLINPIMFVPSYIWPIIDYNCKNYNINNTIFTGIIWRIAPDKQIFISGISEILKKGTTKC